jgi:hypothetical protein
MIRKVSISGVIQAWKIAIHTKTGDIIIWYKRFKFLTSINEKTEGDPDHDERGFLSHKSHFFEELERGFLSGNML